MPLPITVLLMALLAGQAPGGAGTPARPRFPYPFERVDLDNGLRAYLIRAGAPGHVAYVTLVRTGSRKTTW